MVIHGALAKMVVNQNAILSFKISPAFIDTTTLVTAINKQIGATDKALVDRVKRMYPAILLTVLETALDEKKVNICHKYTQSQCINLLMIRSFENTAVENLVTAKIGTNESH